MLIDLTVQEELLLKQSLLAKKEEQIQDLQLQLEILRTEFNEMYDFNSLAFVTINTNYLIQSTNFQAAILLNYDRNQLINKNFLYLINAFDQQSFKRYIQRVRERRVKQTYEVELLQKGKGRKQVSIACSYHKHDLIQLTLKDLSYVRQLESEGIQLKQSLEIFSNLLQNVSDAMAILDKDCYFKILNPAFVQFFSKMFSKKIDVGMNFFSILADFSEYKQQWINAYDQALLGNKTSLLIENPNQVYEANFSFDIHFTPIYNPKSECKEVIILIKDLTEFYLKKRYRLQELSKMAHAMRLTSMEGMASVLAHEINQPLTTIFLYGQTALQQVQKQMKSDNSISPLLKKMIYQAKHASEVMKRMKSFFNQEVSFPEEININALIQEAMVFIDYEFTFSSLKVNLNLDETIPTVFVDKIQIMQIILNLVSNSIDAMKEIKKECPRLQIETYNKKDCIEIHFLDNGPGISAEHQDKILQSYFTTKPHGRGLGLTICRNLIYAHGGKFYINTAEAGAWFVFTLPISVK